jgi:dihydrofolate reductase
MQTILIAAFTDNRVLGKDNRLIWHLPEDLKNFKRLTSGHPVIMGRKTFESLGRPLPNRTNIIITRNADFKAEGCVVVSSLENALQKAEEAGAEKAFVIGGGEIYAQALPIADLMYLTHVHTTLEGDTFFPEFSTQDWQETARQSFEADEKHAYAFDIVTYSPPPGLPQRGRRKIAPFYSAKAPSLGGGWGRLLISQPNRAFLRTLPQ